ncbi:DEAD/DEAH box helicase [Porphyromonas endodontalis]
MTFDELKLSAPLLDAVSALGFTEAMPVQAAVIPYLLEDNIDLIALAQTGTGKTAAYGLPLLEKLRPQRDFPQALVLSPTRELCLQIASDLESFAKFLPEVHVLAVYGGSSIETQIRSLKRGVDIVVATPGRLLDLMRRHALSLEGIHTVVLDEADEMLNMGFSEDLKAILSEIPEERNLLLFSATMSREIATIAHSYLHNPKEITIGRKNEANSNIRHIYYLVPARQRYLALKRIVDFYPSIYGIVFCRTRVETKEIAEHLIADGYNADALHGDLSQEQRDRVMQRFRSGHLQLLVATDVAARGLDVDNLTHVIHYGLPDDVENYTHRSGRTARAGKTGLSIALCHLREKSRIRSIEKLIGAKMEVGTLPSGREICSKHLFHLADRLEHVDSSPHAEEIAAILPEVSQKLSWLDRDELLRRLMTLEFERFFAYYSTAEEIEPESLKCETKEEKRERRNSAPRVVEEGMTRLFINFGKTDRLFPNKLIELINRCVPGRVRIGKIDLMQKFSFFEVDSHDAHRLIEELSQYEVEGRRIIVDYADAADGSDSKRETARGRKDSAPREKHFRKDKAPRKPLPKPKEKRKRR